MVTIEVIINNASSKPIFPSRGVLQGSILSPFLYAIFINELPAFLRTIPMRFPLLVDVVVEKMNSQWLVFCKRRTLTGLFYVKGGLLRYLLR
jgi:hypothetical protein